MKVCLDVDWERRRLCLHEPLTGVVRWSLKWEDDARRIEGTNMTVTMTAAQAVSVAIAITDAKGNPAVVDGLPAWSVSDPAGLALTVDADGMSAVVAAVGPVGSFQLVVSADADLGEGTKPLLGVLDVAIVAGEAVAIGFAVGVPA